MVVVRSVLQMAQQVLYSQFHVQIGLMTMVSKIIHYMVILFEDNKY
jgi:hypothetical protein